MQNVLKWIDEHVEELKATYKRIHEAPELGLKEVHTAAYLAEELRKAGFEVQENVGGCTAVVGTLKGREPGLVLALRSDMDALPMDETSGLPFASKVAGAAHTCGHDANAAMTLFAAKALAQAGIEKGTLKVVFQPAEEIFAGARLVVQSGAVKDVEEMVGVHLRPIAEAKLGEATPALYHGASRMVRMKIKGKASHGARPHLGVNAVDVAVNIVNGVYSLHMDPSVGHSATATQIISHGTAANIVPAEVDLTFDVRARQNALMNTYLDKITTTAKALAEVAGATVEIEAGGCPAAEYDEKVVADLRESIVAILGKTLPDLGTPGGEDFHYFAIEGNIRTAYLGLGADLTPGLHNADMRFDLDALPLGAKILAHFAASKQGVRK